MGILEGLGRSIGSRGVEGTAKRLRENFFPDMGHMVSAPSIVVQENFPFGKRVAVIDRLMNRTETRNGQAELWEAASALAPGTYATRDRVGRTAEGTGHSHFFIVERDEEGVTFLFVDSEANLNQNKREKGQVLREADLRPQVCNLMMVRVRNSEDQPDIAMTRFRTEKMEGTSALSFEALLTLTRGLFDNKGIPPELEDVQNKEVVFRLILEPSKGTPMLVQTRDTKDAQTLLKFLRGQSPGSPTLRGQIRSAAALLTGEFLKHLQSGDFKLMPKLERRS